MANACLRWRARSAAAVSLCIVGFLIIPPGVQARGGGGVGGEESLADQSLEQEGLADRPAPGQWSATLGLGLASESRYQGADTSRLKVVPLAAVRYEDFFLGPFGLGWSAINLKGFHAGPIVGYDAGRNRTDSSNLAGLDDIPSSVTAGAFVTYHIARFEILGTVRQAVTNSSNGLNALLKLDYRIPLSQRQLDLRLGPHLDFANSEYEQSYFGITPAESSQSGLPVFTPHGGLMDVGLHGSLTYFSREHVALRVFADVKKFTGDVVDSPIVLSHTQRFIGAGVAYHFGGIKH
jgi:MipA family protein